MYIVIPTPRHQTTVSVCNGDTTEIKTDLWGNHPSIVDRYAYNSFNQPTQITEEYYKVDLFYGANQQRNKTKRYKNNNLENTCYYFSKDYEREIDANNSINQYHYIYGDNGVVALHTTNSFSGTNNMYYIHTDHLGSYCAITDQNKQTVQRNFFDPWGNYHLNKMVPLDTIPLYTLIVGPGGGQHRGVYSTFFPITARDFTGHEHYPYFKIINMNGRLYDPVIGRFFSPDKYVANSSFTQDYNRYSYARNCPLMYTDPSGQCLWFFALMGVMAGISTGMVMGGIHGATGLDMIGYIVGGAVTGAVSGAVGGLAAGGITGLGFGAGFTSGLTGGLVGGFISGFGNTLLQGGNAGQALTNGFQSGTISGIVGGFTSGIAGGIAAKGNKRDFWTGGYKQYKLQHNYIASTNNDMLFDQYSIPNDATAANTDKYDIYVKHENDKQLLHEFANKVEPGHYIKDPIDGVATSKYKDLVYKIPDGGRVKVLLGGDVALSMGFYDQAKLTAYQTLNPNYEYGWLPLNKLDAGWNQLFEDAFSIWFRNLIIK